MKTSLQNVKIHLPFQVEFQESFVKNKIEEGGRIKNFLICSQEKAYAERFAAFLLEKEEINFRISICSTIEKAIAFSEKEHVDILLLDNSYKEKEREKVKSKNVFLLTETRSEMHNKEQKVFFKYQSAEKILKEIVETCVKGNEEEFFRFSAEKSKKIIAVYSPIRRIGKSAFACALGKELGKKEKVLYIDMDVYNNQDSPKNKKARKDLTDLIYFMKQEKVNAGIWLNALASKIEEMYYLEPMRMAEDLKQVTSHEWEVLFREIVEKSIYDTIILDIGECVQGIPRILELCNLVYCPVLKDEISLKKMEWFVYGLRKEGKEEIKGKMKKFIMPQEIEPYVRAEIKGNRFYE